MITITNEWVVVDEWWKSKPIRTHYAEVIWNERTFMFEKTSHDKVWRIVNVDMLWKQCLNKYITFTRGK